MKVIEIWSFTLVLISLMCYCTSKLNGKCGYPGKPYKAKIEPDNKLEYLEAEEVTYQCIDYLWFPQTRKCERGRWTGEPARCGNSIDGIVTKDVRVEDISSPDEPKLMFEHLNMTLTDSDWANAFASHRFRKAKLRIFDSKRYKWTFKFTAPFHKLFVKIGLNFIDNTLSTAEQKQNFTFNISVYVSPERKCVLVHQSEDISRQNGIDSYFTCDSTSFDAYKRDVENPGDYMIMETQSFEDREIFYDLVVLSFGKSYETSEEPLCGEPEISVSQVSKSVQQYKSYSINCKSEKTWLQVSKHDHIIPETSVHSLRCVADMKWNGSYPECIPRNPCSVDKYLTGSNSNQIVINSLDGLYFLNDTEYYAYEGTKAHYGCENPNISLIRKEIRTCLKNGSWSNNELNCYGAVDSVKFSSYSIIGILSGTLIFVIISIAITFYVYTNRIKTKRISNQSRPTSGDIEVYDDIKVQTNLVGKDAYDIYNTNGNEQEVLYLEPYYIEGQDYVQIAHNIKIPAQSSDDYWRIPSSEPIYLEMIPSPRESLKMDVRN